MTLVIVSDPPGPETACYTGYGRHATTLSSVLIIYHKMSLLVAAAMNHQMAVSILSGFLSILSIFIVKDWVYYYGDVLSLAAFLV